MKTLWHKLKTWLIKMLGGVTKEKHEEERKNFYAHRKVLCEELEAKEKEIKSLKEQLRSPRPYDTPNEKHETIYIEKHLVEPVLFCQQYAVRDFHSEFEEEKIEKFLADNMVQKIADFIVSRKLYETRWWANPSVYERVMEVRVRVVSPTTMKGSEQ